MMNKIIAFRLNPKRAALLKKAQKKFKGKNISQIIEKALENLLLSDEEFEKRIEEVAGSITLPKGHDALKEIRQIRGRE